MKQSRFRVNAAAFKKPLRIGSPPTLGIVNSDTFAASARRIGARMAILCAVMVVLGAGLLAAALWWKARTGAELIGIDDSSPKVTISFDPVDVAAVVAIVGFGAIVLAGGATFLFARQATAPLELAMARQKNFIADASHELRTPLSTMHLRVQQLEMLIDGTDAETTVGPIVKDLRRDTKDMVAIVDDLLQIASSNHDPDARADVGDALAEVERNLRPQADALGIELKTEIGSSISVNVAPVALVRCVGALVTNALSHTPKGGRVTVSADAATIRVRDTGPGIVGIAKERVFDRFSQGAPGALPSHGIGLALVHDTVENAGGTVEVTESSEGGTTFTMTLLPSKNQANDQAKEAR